MRTPRLYVYVAVCAFVTLFLGNTLFGGPWRGMASNPLLASYGHKQKAFNDPTFISSIPQKYVPTLENNRRLVVVGDIHGMYDELNELLNKVDFNPDTDHLVATGDMISKGPDSSAVVALLMELDASAVRGNHENNVLLAWAQANGVRTDTKAKEKHLATAKTLSMEQLEWLANRPLILSVTPLPILIVHGGLVPGLTLVKQDSWAIMNMRSLLMDTGAHKHQSKARGDASDSEHSNSPRDSTISKKRAKSKPEPAQVDYTVGIPSSSRNGVMWADAWNHHQKFVKDIERRTVIYGHDAKSGLRQGDYTVGLDSDCAGGGALTAMIINAADKDEGFKQHIVQTVCKQPDSNKAST
ncbi:Metallo-dependent phosphatase-like protein [Stachybotrys elegans]|uniref:Metallo-dependent phosphatase-like protein n=1 Tax=Stachybotrys elegans TaxID=80388 RepID=A0A8K0SQP6_9HYPO|nr:Metallo-dependent phosphatase-like protein [Stachybotrys elegans]